MLKMQILPVTYTRNVHVNEHKLHKWKEETKLNTCIELLHILRKKRQFENQRNL